MTDDPLAILTSSRSERPDNSGRAHLWPLIIIVLTLLAVAVGYFGNNDDQPGTIGPTISSTPTEREPRVYVISYRFSVFSPTTLRIHAGDTVRFRNDSPLPIRIVAQLQPGQKTPEFDSVGSVEPGSYFSYTFATPGIFGYANNADANESGVIIVR